MAEPTKQSPVKRQFLFNPLKRVMPYIGLILAVLIIIFQGTIRQYTANVVGGWLVNNLRESTQGNYTLSYDFVRFDIISKELRIKNLELALDTTVTSPEQYLKDYSNLVDLSTPTVILKIQSLWDLLVHEKLRIAYIGMEKPKVDLIRSPHLTNQQAEEKQMQTTEEIRSYLEEIEIDSFRIVNGSARVDLIDEEKGEIFDFRVADFSTMLKSFQLSSIDPKKPFQGIYVEEVELEVKDQEIKLPRLNHNLRFERLWVSSKDSTIQLDTVSFQPISRDSAGFKGDINLRQLALTSLDFQKVHDEYTVDLGTITLDKLDMHISDIIKTSEALDGAKNLPNVLFKQYDIDTIQILNSSVKMDLNHAIDVGQINLELRNFSFDSTDLTVQKLVDNITDFDLSVQDSHIELPDSIHEARVDRIDISSANRDIVLRRLRINPIDERRQYSLYKQQGANIISYSSVARLELNGIRFSELLRNHQLYADSLQIFSPSANLTQYPYIKRRTSSNGGSFPYLIENIAINNGRLNFNRRENARNNRTELLGINVEVKGLYPENETTPTFDQLHFEVVEGSTELKNIAHKLVFNELSSNNLRRFDIGRFHLLPDSVNTNKSSYDLRGTGFSLIGYSRDFLANPSFLELEEVSAQTISANLNFVLDTARETSPPDLKELVVNRFYFNEADVKFSNNEVSLEFENLSSFVDSLHYSALDSSSAIPVQFKDLQLSHGRFNFSTLGTTKFDLSGQSGKFSEVDSMITFIDLNYKIADQLDGSLKNIGLKGFNREQFLKSKILKFNYATLDEPNMELYINPDETTKNRKGINNALIRKALLSQFRRIDFDSLSYSNGNVKLISDSRTTSFENSNIRLINYEFDSTTSLINILRPKEFGINVAKVTSQSETDTADITGVAVDFVRDRLFTGKVNYRAAMQPEGMVSLVSPGLSVSGFKLSKLIQQDYSADTILLNNTSIMLATEDSTNNMIGLRKESEEITTGVGSLFRKNPHLSYDSILRTKIGLLNLNEIELDSNQNINFMKVISGARLASVAGQEGMDSLNNTADYSIIDTVVHVSPTNGKVGFIGMANSSFAWYKSKTPHEYLGDLKFSLALDQLALDTLNAFNIYDHIHDIKLSISDYTFVLPDSLNQISLDKLNFSSHNESIRVQNLKLTPLVNKYEYANKVGRQAGWHDLSDLDIQLSHLDVHKLIDQGMVHLKSLETNGGVLDIFKDKELPIPADQYRPMLQDAIKGIALPFLIDTIDIADFTVHFSSRLSSDMPEGSISFNEITGKSGNLTNIDTILFDHSELKLKSSTKIMNDGLLTANFTFNMIDPENSFAFDGHLTSMSARDFNSLLEATAYVKIESGDIKDIDLSAAGDNFYALGKMTFQYNDLKVSTINKRNLKTTGMGKVVKTFFANAFVVKKNNPSVKFFPRVGDMYYERDTQKIIIDYVTKTAMSGIVSSIGARNFRKEIKKIQKESKKQLDEEKKAQKKAERMAATP